MTNRLGCFNFAAIFFVGILASHSNAQNATHSAKLTYPKAEQVEQVDDYHGILVKDPFRWLEDMESEETRQWVNAQDELTKNFLSTVPARAAIHERISALWNFDLYTIPVKANHRYFYAKTDAGKSRPALYVQEKIDQPPRILVDPFLQFDDKETVVKSYWPSPDGRWLAYAVAKGQSRWWRLKIVDAESGKDHADELVGLHIVGGGIAWTQDGFFYIRFDLPEEGSELKAAVENPKIYYHRLGTPQTKDQLIFARPDKPQWLFNLQTTSDGRYLIITAREGSDPANRIYYKNLQAPHAKVEALLDEADAAYTFLGNKGTRFWFHTDFDAPRGRVITLDITKPQRQHWTEVIAEAEETIAAGSLVGGNALGLFGNHFVVMYVKDGLPLIKVFNLQGRFQYEVDLPNAGSVWGGFSGAQNDHEVFYQFLGVTDPSSIQCLNLKTGKRTIFRRSELSFDADQFIAKQVFYQSKDGTRVPMFVAHKKGLQLNGRNPAFMYGYGAFGWTSFMWYQPQVLLWMEMGGVYALPGIRGGGEYGEAWHQAGMKLDKQNAIDDYLAAAEWLIANKYTSPAKLVANGGSASGSLAGAALLQRPDLFGACIIDRPALDMIRFEKFTTASYWIQEFGVSTNPEELKALLAYSPYHNLKSGQCYPPTMIMIGDRDQVTAPMHAYKFTAAMQAAQSCDHPVLLKMMWGAGHNFGATPEQVIDSITDEITFLARVMNLKISLN